MSPAKPPIYIGCGCVVPDGQGRYLLVRETKAVARGRLALPGGGLEPDESLVAAAAREVLEETGLTVQIDGLLGIFHCERTSENSYGVNFIFEGAIVAGQVTVSDEHPEIVWKTAAEVGELHAQGSIRGGHVPTSIARSEQGSYLDENTVTGVSATD